MNTIKPGSQVASDDRFHVGRNLVLQAAAQFSNYFVALTLMPLIIKVAGAGIYGSLAVYTSLITLVTQLSTLGVGFHCRRQLPNAQNSAEAGALFFPAASWQFLTYAVTGVLLMSALPFLHPLFSEGEVPVAPWIVPCAALALWTNNLADDYFRYTHRIQHTLFISVARSVLYPGLVLLFALSSHTLTLTQLLAAQAMGYFLPAAVGWVLIHREVPVRFRLEPWNRLRSDIAVGLPLVGAVVVENLLAASDRYILAGAISPTHVGAYAVAYAVGSLILLIPRVVTSVLPAAMSRAVDAGREGEAKALFRKATYYYLLLSVPFAIGSALLAPELLVLLGNDRVAELARWTVPLVAIGAGLYGYTWLLYNTLFVDRTTGTWLRANLVAAGCSIALNFFLVTYFRTIEAAGATMIISYALSLSIVLRYRNKTWDVRLPLTTIVRASAAAAVMALCVFAVSYACESLSPLPRLAIQISTGMGSYALALLLSHAIPPDDMQRVRSLLKTRAR